MFELKEDSIRVVDGKLCRFDEVIDRPAILVFDGVVTKVGNYNSLFKEMLDLEIREGRSSEGFGLHLLNLCKYPDEYFNIEDACYVVRRCCEFLDDEVIREFLERYGNVGFFEWFYLEKEKVSIQTRII